MTNVKYDRHGRSPKISHKTAIVIPRDCLFVSPYHSRLFIINLSLRKLKTVLTVLLLAVTKQQTQFLIFANFQKDLYIGQMK